MVVCVTYCMAGDNDGGGVVTIASVKMVMMKFKMVVCYLLLHARLGSSRHVHVAYSRGAYDQGFILNLYFYRTESDLWQPLSMTH